MWKRKGYTKRLNNTLLVKREMLKNIKIEVNKKVNRLTIIYSSVSWTLRNKNKYYWWSSWEEWRQNQEEIEEEMRHADEK